MASGQDVARQALAEKSEIGGRSLPNTQSGNKYCAWYGMDGYWCAMFVSYVVSKAGASGAVPRYSWCQDCIDYARSQGRLYSRSQITSGKYTPQPGDIFFRSGDHTGIVVSVSGSGFTSVEGNTNGAGPGQRTVDSNHFDFNSERYTHIFNPAYPDSSSSGISFMKPQRETVITVPSGLGKYYTYERWNRSDWLYNQKKLCTLSEQRSERRYDSEGYGMIGNRYVIAMTSTFGTIGDYVDVYCGDGRVIHAIIGDEKDQTTAHGTPANKWGHDEGQCIVEWMTNWSKHENPSGNGGVVKVINLGNYFDYPEYASGNEEYLYSENEFGEINKEPTVVWNNRVQENIMPAMENLSELIPKDELLLYANDKDITKCVGNLSWKNSIYELATTLTFENVKSDAAYLADLIYVPQDGDIIRMVTNAEVFRGIVIKADDGDKHINKYSVVDLGWYLNKTSQTYQFKNITAQDAIKEICADLSVNIVMLPELTTLINQIYFDKTISSILTDILDKCGGDYNYDFVPEGLRIYAIGDLVAYPEFRIADNIPQTYSPEYRGSVSHSFSIENMVNSVKVTSEKDNVFTELKVLQNRELIDKFGFLQRIVKIDPEKENADEVAQRELTAGAQVAESFSCEIIEKYDSYTRAGEVIPIGDQKYVIESTDHSLKDGWHFTKLQLKKIT